MRLLKKSAAVITAAALIASFSCLTYALETLSLGDVDENGSLSIADAILVNRLAAEEAIPVSEMGMLNADTDYDGLISVSDSARILQYLAGLLTGSEFYGASIETEYDISGFAYQWPEVFSIDDTVTITENSYKSHDVSITITDYISDNLAYYVADIYVRDLDCFRAAFAKGTYPEPRSGQTDSIINMATENNAILAINADYCEIRYTGIIYRNGVLYRDQEKDDVAVIYRDGVMKTYTKAGFNTLTAEQRDEIWHTATFGPALVMDGVAITGHSSGISGVNPRSGLGYYEPGHYCFVQCDGRQEGYSLGLTMDDFALLFESLGCVEAYNLDGGTTSEMVFNGERYNRPYNNGRYSSDIFYICENSD